MHENAINWRERVAVDPLVCHGKPCIRGTRVMVSVVLDNIAAGEPFDRIADDYHIQVEDVQACEKFPSKRTR